MRHLEPCIVTRVATVGLVPRSESETARSLASEMTSWLEQRGHTALITRPDCGTEIAARADLLVVLGGDGTLILAASMCGTREVPILGVNLGRLGFLTEVPRERAFEMLELALDGKLQVSKRLMLSVQVKRGGEVLFEGSVLNDAVVSKNAVARLAKLEVTFDGRRATSYEADGLIVATPTGSTAYSLSAAGPIVYPTLDAILLTPICPHTLTQRPLVLPPDSPVSVKLVSESEMFVTLDGSRGRSLAVGDEMVVSRAPHRTLLLRNPDVDPFTILREKLRWGSR
jgi:NAD+ kinase